MGLWQCRHERDFRNAKTSHRRDAEPMTGFGRFRWPRRLLRSLPAGAPVLSAEGSRAIGEITPSASLMRIGPLGQPALLSVGATGQVGERVGRLRSGDQRGSVRRDETGAALEAVPAHVVAGEAGAAVNADVDARKLDVLHIGQGNASPRRTLPR